MINLDEFASQRGGAPGGGIVQQADRDASTAWVNAGARLLDLSPALEREGLAFRNLGDINVQSLAGAAGTATHGTGASFSCLSAEIRSVRLMTAEGEVVEARLGEDTDLVLASQVSLGALGILLEAELQLAPRFRLHRRTWAAPLARTLAEADRRWAQHRNFEFFILPHSGYALNLTHDETNAEPTPRPPSEDEEALAALRKVRDLLSWSPWLRRKALAGAISRFPEENVVGDSWRLLASVRETRFNEMEYHLPPASAFEALEEVVDVVERTRRDVYFPIEVRRTAGDNAWLSPFQQGTRISVAVHADADDDHEWLFTAIEPIFRRAGGRPHWGKLHSLKAAELADLYPDFERFRTLRREMDPQGRFLNAHLAGLFGESAAA